jgi:hypothetical protein
MLNGLGQNSEAFGRAVAADFHDRVLHGLEHLGRPARLAICCCGTTAHRARVGQHGRRARISLSLTTLFCAFEKVFTDSYKTYQEIRHVTGTELCEKYESVIKEPG